MGADPDDLAFVPNATAGVNTVLRSLRFQPGDEILVTDHEYNAALNAARYVAARDGARVVVAEMPFPIRSPGAGHRGRSWPAVTPRTRLALVSHVTSPTALVFPIADAGRRARPSAASTRSWTAPTRRAWCRSTWTPSAPPTTPATVTSGCAGPRGRRSCTSAATARTASGRWSISHGANSVRADRSRFRLEFDWTGTADPTAFLSLPTAIRFMGSLLPGGWPELMAANRALALAGRDLLCEALGVEAPAPDEMLGSMAAVPLPRLGDHPALPPGADVARTRRSSATYRMEVPITAWPVDAVEAPGGASPARFVRISAQRYNDIGQYAALADALREMFGPG